MATLVSISASAIQASNESNDIENLRRIFADNHAIILPDFVEQGLLATLQRLVSTAQFETRSIDRIGTQEVENGPATRTLALILSSRQLLDWIEQVTGYSGLRHLRGGVMRLAAGSLQQLAWHDDVQLDPKRHLAMTINLGNEKYDGGEFELKKKTASEASFRYHHQAAGTAVLFRIDPTLEHRVTAVVKGGPRIVYAGWFG